ncbi:MAG TPA: hypothetical protein VIE89_01640 [Candidatus Binatia bacterium]|jgi:predicted transcriptional regulator
MSETKQPIRQKLHDLAEELPPDASWDDVIEEARFRKAVELGIAAADRGSFATDEEVRKRLFPLGRKNLKVRWTRPALADLSEAQDYIAWPNGADFDPATLHNWPEVAPALKALADKWDPPDSLLTE